MLDGMSEVERGRLALDALRVLEQPPDTTGRDREYPGVKTLRDAALATLGRILNAKVEVPSDLPREVPPGEPTRCCLRCSALITSRTECSILGARGYCGECKYSFLAWHAPMAGRPHPPRL